MSSQSHAGAMSAKHMGESNYLRLVVIVLLSFGAMYVLMYAMVNRFENVYANINQFYMAGLMTAAMVVIEMALMGGMSQNQRLRGLVSAAGAIALIGFWLFTRRQTAISDKQFLRSMIPHHAGAILRCEQASIGDTEIKRLCQSIITGQQSEIDQMKAMLRK